MFAVLRFLHIIAGIIWAGGAILMNLVIGPAIGATGDAGRQFAGHLMGETAFSKVMLGCGLTTVLAGTYLYGVSSNWFTSGWMMSGPGIGFGVGAVAGILALVFGFMIGNTNGALAALGAQIQGKPTDAHMAAMGALRKRQVFVTTANTIFILISIALMASARLFR
ncbi:MAG: hypothetical protein QY332_02820 [Anaerolineales bacterium]|nr:MAG: hypothetical protein QY332_02820 [Anaerolineales bacterium]